MSMGSPFKSFDNMSWQEKMDFVTGLLFFPALTVMVFLRWRLGFRRVKPLHLIALMFILMALGNGNPLTSLLPQNGWQSESTFPFTIFERSALGWFGVAVLIAGGIQNRIQWWDINRGVSWHTHSTGISWLEYPFALIPDWPLRMPAWFPFTPTLRPSAFIIRRYLDPILCIIIASQLRSFAPLLSGWLIFSGIALAGFEQALFDKQLEQSLNLLDGLVNSEVQRETANHYMKNGVEDPSAKPLSLKDTAGIPTGIAPDIAKQIAIRQRKQEQQARDDANALAATPTIEPIIVPAAAEISIPVSDTVLAPQDEKPSTSIPDNLV